MDGSPDDWAPAPVTAPAPIDATMPLPRLRPEQAALAENERPAVTAGVTTETVPHVPPAFSATPADTVSSHQVVTTPTGQVSQSPGAYRSGLTAPDMALAGTATAVGAGGLAVPNRLPPNGLVDGDRERLLVEIDEILASHAGQGQSSAQPPIVFSRAPEAALPPPMVILPPAGQLTPTQTGDGTYAGSWRPPLPPADIPNVEPMPPAVPLVGGGIAASSIVCLANRLCWAIPASYRRG